MVFKYSALFLIVLLPVTSFAQKQATPGSLYSKCENYLQCALEIASTKSDFWKKEISRISELGADFKPCDFDHANVYFQYYDWMRKNREELLRIEAMLNSVNEQVRTKVSEIQNLKLEVGAVQGQSQSSYSIAFSQIAAYLSNLNERLSKLGPDEVATLMRVQENYLSNKLGVAHSQIMAAIELTNAGINASLKEKSSSFSVELIQRPGQNGVKALDYILKYRGDVLNQKIQLDVSLLGADANRITGMSEAEKWKALTSSSLKIGDYLLDGQMRYSAMRLKFSDPACILKEKERPMFKWVALPLVTEETKVMTSQESNRWGQVEFCLMPASALVSILNSVSHYESNYIVDHQGKVWAEFYSNGAQVRVSRPVSIVYGEVQKYTEELIERMRKDFNCSELDI
jgi:hypothetical protein